MFSEIVLFEKETAIKWQDGTASYINTHLLRVSCPCAFCSGEKDVFGSVYSGDNSSLVLNSFQIIRFEKVGHYGLRFFWKDGHKDGIYTYSFLRELGSNET